MQFFFKLFRTIFSQVVLSALLEDFGSDDRCDGSADDETHQHSAHGTATLGFFFLLS